MISKFLMDDEVTASWDGSTVVLIFKHFPPKLSQSPENHCDLRRFETPGIRCFPRAFHAARAPLLWRTIWVRPWLRLHTFDFRSASDFSTPSCLPKANHCRVPRHQSSLWFSFLDLYAEDRSAWDVRSHSGKLTSKPRQNNCGWATVSVLILNGILQGCPKILFLFNFVMDYVFLRTFDDVGHCGGLDARFADLDYADDVALLEDDLLGLTERASQTRSLWRIFENYQHLRVFKNLYFHRWGY